MTSTADQRRRIHILTGYDPELKAAYVVDITKDPKKTSTKDLTPTQAQSIINKLAMNWAAFDKDNPKHLLILSLLMQMGWTRPSERFGEVADLGRFNAFLKSLKSPVRKPLLDMTPAEVSQKLIPCLESMIGKQYAK
ncbi:MAG: hypothetical protein JJE55_07035 [Flavobacteriaceae bacterium]|nr:hypothetical protein [Flavobacteriaceae bacterium]